MQPQGDSIWGNINLCIEIALNIYYLCGEKGEGIVIPKEQAEKDFSPETVAVGKESDGYLYYPKGEAMEMFRHEMLQKRLVMIKKMELAATEQMEAVRKGGQAAALARFQDIELPGDREENKKRIWNGIYILNGEEQKIAVHERIAEAFLTPYACEFGRRENGYFYYTLQSAALPLYELKGMVPECQEMIVSEESLYATICTHYPAYRERYNALVAQEQQIPQIDAPANLFCRSSLTGGRQKRMRKLYMRKHLQRRKRMRTNMENRWIMDLAHERGRNETCLYRKSPSWGKSFGEGL